MVTERPIETQNYRVEKLYNLLVPILLAWVMIKNVKIIFTDSKGNTMKEVDVKEKGQGQMNVYAQDLSSGIYTYTLIADGAPVPEEHEHPQAIVIDVAA